MKTQSYKYSMFKIKGKNHSSYPNPENHNVNKRGDKHTPTLNKSGVGMF